jgi:SAM-dependent methyltransferase
VSDGQLGTAPLRAAGAVLDLMRSGFLSNLLSLRRRYSTYLATEIDKEVSEDDDMLADGKLDHYLSVGQSAIDVVARAMVAAQKDRFSSVLDLPCGGGRVTRHLRAFLPEAQLFVGDLNKLKEEFVVAKFGAVTIDPRADFSVPSAAHFDLIFVGSLVTHVGLNQYTRAIRWFVDALAPEGLLIFTTHGRRTFHLFNGVFHAQEWRGGCQSYVETGFGYQPYEAGMAADGPASYGTSLSAPSWVARLIEADPEVRILSLAEGAWANNQDVVVLQKRPIAAG